MQIPLFDSETPKLTYADLPPRIRHRVRLTDDECWIWQGAKSRRTARRGEDSDRVNRYGTVSINGRSVRIHRLIYERLRGPISEGLTLDHLCRTTLCVNPDHLEPVTPGMNNARARAHQALHATVICDDYDLPD